MTTKNGGERRALVVGLGVSGIATALQALPEDVEIRSSTVPSRIEQDADGVDGADVGSLQEAVAGAGSDSLKRTSPWPRTRQRAALTGADRETSRACP